MASSIEIASAPFDNVLRDHNRRIRDNERECNSKARFAFQKNIDELVRDHLNNCWESNEERNGHSFGLVSVSRNDENRRGESESEVESEARRRQTKILDRWAARQARDMITTIERQTHEAELLALSNSQSVSERASTFLRETSPAPSDSSVEVPNLRASSLVQMWKEFEAEAISPRGRPDGVSPNANQSGGLNSNSNIRYSRLNSTKSYNSVGESPRSSVTDDNVGSPDYSFMEWESEQTASSEQRVPSLQMQSSDMIDGAKVADIVKRLTSASGSQTTQSSITSLSSGNDAENEHEQDKPLVGQPPSAVEHSISVGGEQRDPKFNKKHLRVRGRQATKDLLMQMQQERQREISDLADRRAVSLFPHRGRIQSLLRLKFLQRGVAVQDQKRPASTASELDQLNGRSTIFLLRERFSSRAKKDGNAQVLNEDASQTHAHLQNATQNSGKAPVLNEEGLRSHKLQTHTQLPSAIQNRESSSISDPLTNEAVHHEDATTLEHSVQTVITIDHTMQSTSELTVTIDHSLQSISEQNDDHSMQSTSEQNGKTACLSLPSATEHIQESDFWNSDVAQQGFCVENLVQLENETTLDSQQGDIVTEQIELNTMQQLLSRMLAEEPDSNTLHPMESPDGSSLNDVSCHRRGWECQRQTWYSDRLESDSRDEEMHKLLERKTVSNLLASSFRKRMDRLILLRLQKHPEIFGSVEQEESMVDHYQEITGDPDQVDSPSFQLPLPSRIRPWSQYEDQEHNNDSGHLAYASLQPPQPSSSDYQDSQQCSPFTSHPSLEMELIYDLKGHIERLQYEMSELRESLKSCMGMQVKLQNSIKQEVAAAVCRTIQGEGAMEFSDSTPKKKGNCCICCSTQVDSLLYRCGHMCTCFKCAHELQWSSSRCPMCRAPILDVVRAYSYP